MRRMRPALVTAVLLALLTVAMVGAQEGFFFQEVTITVKCKGKDCPKSASTSATAATAATSPSTLDTTIVIEVSGIEIGAGKTGDVVLTATNRADYACFNKGGNNPNAANKTSIVGPTGAQGIFPVNDKGVIQFSLEAFSVGPGTFTCPPGQTLKLCQSTFTNVTISDPEYGRSLILPGPFSLAQPLCVI
jgi:hypothetical protein